MLYINNIGPFGLAIWFLDDGYRDIWTWDLCIAQLSKEDLDVLDNKLKELGLTYKFRKDTRYIRFNNESTRVIDKMILDNIPNNLDIVRNKLKREVMI